MVTTQIEDSVLCMCFPHYMYVRADDVAQSKISTRQWAENNDYNVEKLFHKVSGKCTIHEITLPSSQCHTKQFYLCVFIALPGWYPVPAKYAEIVGEENPAHSPHSSPAPIWTEQWVMLCPAPLPLPTHTHKHYHECGNRIVICDTCTYMYMWLFRCWWEQW